MRSSPNAENDENILFKISQNSLVYLFDKNREGRWIKIKKDDNHIGWVNGSCLRDFYISSIKIVNHDDKGHAITEPGEILYASHIKHLGIQFNVDTTNGYNKKTRFYLKLIPPNNVPIQGKNIRLG